MGKGFWILVWEDWGSGLVMINPKLLEDGTLDIYGNPNNWWAYQTDEEKQAKVKELTKGYNYFKVIG
jgi:hypothetical protein